MGFVQALLLSQLLKHEWHPTHDVAVCPNKGIPQDPDSRSNDEKQHDNISENESGATHVSVAERVAKLGQSLSHAVAARPIINQKPEIKTDCDNDDKEAENQELTISDRIDKLGKRLDIKMAPPKAPKQEKKDELFSREPLVNEEKPIKVSDRLNLFEKKAEEEQRVVDEQAKMYERLSKSNSSGF